MRFFRKHRDNRRLHMIGDEERKRYMRNRKRQDISKKVFKGLLRPAIHLFSLSLNIVFLVMLLLSGLATQISPEVFVLPSYLSLAFSLLVIINILYVILWVIRLKVHFIYSLFVLILLSTNIQNNFPLHIFSSDNKEKALEDKSGTDVTIMSFNVKLFDFYKKDQQGRNSTIDYILSKKADIICIQEYGFYNDNSFLSKDEINYFMHNEYPYEHTLYAMNSNKRSSYGIALYSKYPIVRKGEVKYGSKYNLTSISDIEINNNIIRVINCHLESNQFTGDDKKKMMETVKDTGKDKFSETTGLVTKKLSKASKARAKQAEAISNAIHDSNIPVIVCGDLNDAPASYTYKKVRGDLGDAFTSTSSGLGITYNELPFWFRIDYILHSKILIPYDFKIDKVELSDHYPISCKMHIPQAE